MCKAGKSGILESSLNFGVEFMLDYRHCTLCPRACGVDRAAGERGFCQMPDHILAARAALHYWEEPVISGSFGSGAVFSPAARCAARSARTE